MTNKPIFLLGEAWGSNEERIKAAFVGPSGVELLKMLNEVGIIEFSSEDKSYISKFYNEGKPQHLDMVWRLHPEVYRSNVFNAHPPANDLKHFCGPKAEGIYGYGPLVPGKYISQTYRPHLERLANELIDVDPNLVICFGNAALWALTARVGLSKLRGTTLSSTMLASGFKLLPTYHPAYVLRQWELRPTVIIDLMKAAREASFPEVRRPKRLIWVEPTLADLETFYANHILHCPLLSVDIETAGTAITEIGFATAADVAIVIPFFDKRRKTKSYWESATDEVKAWQFVSRVLQDSSIPKLFQNGLYDIPFILRTTGIRVRGAKEDTMLLHHSLYPESLKSLGYLGSLYCDEGAWKSMRKHTTIKRDE